MAGYSVRGTRTTLRKLLLGFFVLVFIGLIIAVISVRQHYVANLQPVSTSAESQLVAVESGSSAKQIGAQLKKAGLIRDATVFEWYVRNHDVRDKLQAGSYYLRPNMNVPEIIGILTQGKVASDLLTILPGKRVDQIKEAFVKAGYSKPEVDAAFNPDIYKDHPALSDKPAGASLEGYLYPDSYAKTATTKPETIIRQSLDVMQKHLTPDVRAGFVKQGLTVHEGVSLASIVEKEVSKASDRPTVAQVFVLRLQSRIELGSDVTALYGAIVDGLDLPSDSAAATSIGIAHNSPYNTRMHPGLPPGPISNVSVTSLRAVAFPASTDYLFFVAGDDGTTYFSHTLQEHEANAQAYCHKLCGR